ncbi:MAG: CoA pyrophosphatase [Flavobacteriales bacterium]|nr:CoA pyrophosphatase [Flavobacteriales bacterium]
MDTFLDKLQHSLTQPLPGEKAYGKMLRAPRPSVAEVIKSGKNPRKSAVLLLLYPKQNQLHTVLTLRPGYKGVHSGQVSFPGGKMEPNDADEIATALREANEEVNVDPRSVNVIGKLSQLYIPPSNFIVDPIVGYSPEIPDFQPEEREVEQIILAPVQRIMEKDVIRSTTIHLEQYNTSIEAKYFDIADQIVWGATAMILAEFRDIIQPFWRQGL